MREQEKGKREKTRVSAFQSKAIPKRKTIDSEKDPGNKREEKRNRIAP